MPATFTIVGLEGERQVALRPQGVIIGRVSSCDIQLNDERVSRHHARVFQDPFGRWIIEDLGSRNGVRVNDEKVRAHALLSGEKVVIGPCTLTFESEAHRQIAPDASAQSSTTILTDQPVDQVVRARAEEGATLSRARLKNLNAIIDRLAALPGPERLYVELCRLLARAPGTMAMVLRMSEEPFQPPQALAAHLGGTDDLVRGEAGNIHISRRVLEAVRSEGVAVMAGAAAAQTDVTLTIEDQTHPRVVFCAPTGEPKETRDVLYLDVPAEQAMEDTFDFVQAVARQVGLARKNHLLAQARSERQLLDHQLAMAREIQARLMPGESLRMPGLDVAVRYQPAMWVGGDYCDVWTTGDGRLALVVGDVAGKGLPAAMVMASLQAALRNTLAFCHAPAEALTHVDHFLHDHLPEKVFITLFLGLFDPADGRLEYVNAGHPQPLIVRGQETGPLGVPSNMPLGLASIRPSDFRADTEILAPGSGLIVVSDGVTESTSPRGELFGDERLCELVRTTEAQSADFLARSVAEAAEEFRQPLAQQDDLTVLALLYRGE